MECYEKIYKQKEANRKKKLYEEYHQFLIKMHNLVQLHKNTMQLLKVIEGAEIYLTSVKNFIINIMQL